MTGVIHLATLLMRRRCMIPTGIPHCQGGLGRSHTDVILQILSRCLRMSEVLIRMHIMFPRAQELILVHILHHPLSTIGFDTQYITRRGLEDSYHLDMKELLIHHQHQGHRIVAFLEMNHSIIGLHHHG